MLLPGAAETLAWRRLTWPGHFAELGWVGCRVGLGSAVSSAGADFSYCRNVLTVLILASPKPLSAIHNFRIFLDSEKNDRSFVHHGYSKWTSSGCLGEEEDSGGHSA